MKKLVWRLGKLPSVEELRELVKDKIITQDEAREILFSSETEEDRDKKGLESEIKFLRELVEKLSSGSSTRIVEVIKEVHQPYWRHDWYLPYQIWCTATQSGSSTLTITGASTVNAMNTANSAQSNAAFSSIKTF